MNAHATANNPHKPAGTRTVDRLRVAVYPDRAGAGHAAGVAVAAALRAVLDAQPQARVMFASAPSQREMLATLRAAPGIDWARITAFHMDEYVGLSPEAPQRFGRFLIDTLFDAVRPGAVHLLHPDDDPGGECHRYADLLGQQPLDVVCLGIGENGHLAFNDPPDADLDDPEAVKVVRLSDMSRAQQVNEGCFARLDEVPQRAVTVTVPVLLSGRRLVCTVPGASKREAVHQALTGPVDARCPASVLRTHPDCTLYLDVAASDSPEVTGAC